MTSQTTDTESAFALVERAQQAATALAKFRNDLEPILREEIGPAWGTFLTHAISKAGLNYSREFTSTGTGSTDYSSLDLNDEGARFHGCDHSYGDYDTYDTTIPWDFINPDTRRDAEERIECALAKEKAANDAAARKQADHQAAAKRKADEKELADLARRLGKTVVD